MNFKRREAEALSASKPSASLARAHSPARAGVPKRVRWATQQRLLCEFSKLGMSLAVRHYGFCEATCKTSSAYTGAIPPACDPMHAASAATLIAANDLK